jgi:class 3 adenylate cyclase
MAGPRVQRRLAAILAGDVAGYSRMMGADEEGTLFRLNTHRREFLEPKIAEHRGRIVKRTGDGVLIEFASAVDATRCALEIQGGMVERNAPVPQDKRIEFRIGIHIGDVIIEDGDIFGDGVNIAARLESIAEPGGICISDDAYRQVHGKLDGNFQDAAWNFFPCHGLALGHFSLGHYEKAAAAARKAIQFNPGFSMSHMLLAASLAKMGRLGEAKDAAAQVLALQPSYRFGKHFAGVDCAAALAASLSEALRTAGLPE